jgi:hypothetical protein
LKRFISIQLHIPKCFSPIYSCIVHGWDFSFWISSHKAWNFSCL